MKGYGLLVCFIFSLYSILLKFGLLWIWLGELGMLIIKMCSTGLHFYLNLSNILIKCLCFTVAMNDKNMLMLFHNNLFVDMASSQNIIK